MNEDLDYINHILECLDWIARFTEPGREAFFADRKTQSATLRELQTVAESTQRLAESFKQAHPEISWRSIAGFRNVLVHDYLGINLERIWETIERDLPPFRIAIEAIQHDLQASESSSS